jgi:hypothetical protein
MPYSDVYFLGTETTFRLNGSVVGTLSEGISLDAQVSPVVAAGKMVSVTSDTLTFETKFFFTGDASNRYARVITYGSEFYRPDPSAGDIVPSPSRIDWIPGFDWHQPGLTDVPPSADSEVYSNWFAIGAGYNYYTPPRITAGDGLTVNGNAIITSASARFSAADVGASVRDFKQALAPGAIINGVDAAANTATLNFPCVANSSGNTFVITRSAAVPDVGDPWGYNLETITIGDESDPGSYIRVNPGWRAASIAIYAPLASQYRSGRAYGIKGGKTRCRDINDQGDTVTSAAWGFPHSDYDRKFGIIQAHSSAYGWGVGVVTFLWIPTAVPSSLGRAVGLTSQWVARVTARRDL